MSYLLVTDPTRMFCNASLEELKALDVFMHAKRGEDIGRAGIRSVKNEMITDTVPVDKITSLCGEINFLAGCSVAFKGEVDGFFYMAGEQHIKINITSHLSEEELRIRPENRYMFFYTRVIDGHCQSIKIIN